MCMHNLWFHTKNKKKTIKITIIRFYLNKSLIECFRRSHFIHVSMLQGTTLNMLLMAMFCSRIGFPEATGYYSGIGTCISSSYYNLYVLSTKPQASTEETRYNNVCVHVVTLDIMYMSVYVVLSSVTV